METFKKWSALKITFSIKIEAVKNKRTIRKTRTVEKNNRTLVKAINRFCFYTVLANRIYYGITN